MFSRLAHQVVALIVVVALVAGGCSASTQPAPAADSPPNSSVAAAAELPAPRHQAPKQANRPSTSAPVSQIDSAPEPAAPAVRQPCPSDIADGWTCITLAVPVDHFNDTGMTTDVTFALKRHTGRGPAKGTFVTITGGPGSAGIYSAVDYSSYFAPSVLRSYDLVFMDQRGSGMSGGFTCLNATLDFYTTSAGPDDPDGGAALADAAETFVNDCIAESGVDEAMLPYYATTQAVEDLEAFRVWLGVDKLTLYGESYGTQYVQTYAAAHPDQVEILMLDGPVDLVPEGADYYVEGTTAVDQVTEATLLDCTVQSVCSQDVVGGNQLTVYDELTAQLDSAPVEYTFTYADGTQEQRTFTATDLENAVAGSVNNLSRRRLLQRAVTAASRGDHWWLARLAYAGVAQHPDTYEAIPDPSWSDALFYAVECTDYAYFPDAGTPDERAAAYIEYGREHGVYDTRNPGNFTGDLPCVYWPAQPGPNSRPTPDANVPYPIVIMASTLDPATPMGNAQRIYERHAESEGGVWLIYQPGGPHVLYGRDFSCPDDYITDMMVEGDYPRQTFIACPGDLVYDYARVPDDEQIASRGARALLTGYDDELNYGVDYWDWDYSEPLAFGCAFGGTVEYTATARGSRLVMDECSFVQGTAATGTGKIDDYSGAFRLRVTFEGDWGGRAVYNRDGNGRKSLTGNVAYQP